MCTAANCRTRNWTVSNSVGRGSCLQLDQVSLAVGRSCLLLRRSPARLVDGAEALREQVADCRDRGGRLVVVGHGSKPRFPVPTDAEELSTCGHTGIVEYRPEELVITARAGTSLAELDDAVTAQGQILPFDPPRFGGRGTLGGAVASGLSGPARPWRGSVRDAVLGVELINGLGQRLRFGGSVMKNVAGYDVSRLATGAAGRLGVVLSASVRVLPAPEADETVCVRCTASEAGDRLRRWAHLPLPITGTCYVDGVLSVRLSGSAVAIARAKAEMSMAELGDDGIWAAVRDMAHPFFAASRTLARLSLPRGATFAGDEALIEWGGCRVWARTKPADALALTFTRNGPDWQVSAPRTDATVAKYAARVRSAFDPDSVFVSAESP